MAASVFGGEDAPTESVMRIALSGFVVVALGLAVLMSATRDASAGGFHRGYSYGPPRVYVMPPRHRSYPRPLYRYCPPGYVVGPGGSYYPRPVPLPRDVRFYRYPQRSRKHW